MSTSKTTKTRKFLARLVDSSNVDEPDLSRAYLAEILESSGEYIEYWEDALCCTADAKMKLEYDS